MDWIKRAIEERATNRDLSERLEQGVGPIWASLVQALKDSAAAYQSSTPKYGDYEESTQNHHVYALRYLIHDPAGNPFQKGVLIKLDKSEQLITAQYSGSVKGERSAALDLLGGDGDVCLIVDGSPMLTQDAAEYFLKPFLFPELDSV